MADIHRKEVTTWRRTGAEVSLFLLEDQLRLRDDGRELAVAASDAGLQHDGGAAAMQRHAYGARGIALGHGGEEIGLALDRGGAPVVGQAHARGQAAERVAQRRK